MISTLPERTLTDLPFAQALTYLHAHWEQGQHISLIGPTGMGKTFAKRYILRRRQYVTSFITKGEDEELDRIIREEGFEKQPHSTKGTQHWDGSKSDLIALWPHKPRGRTPEEFERAQKIIFTTAIHKMVDQGRWCLDFDELSYMCDFLGMDRLMRWLLQQGRSSKISVVAATQRPSFIPHVFYSMPEWLVFWNNTDDTDLKRIQGLGGVDGKILRNEVMRLKHREIIIVHNRHPYERIRTLVRV
jgi:hypothetical protein